jgi:Rps23 Pro-64 3,4-dihydroxylase Tpa1-like proline 4-hydroxylase
MLVACAGTDRWWAKACQTVVPGFNTLSIFKVRPDMLDHDVSVVTTPTKRRYAVTGWWYLKEDSFSEAERAEQKKQRGAYGEL